MEISTILSCTSKCWRRGKICDTPQYWQNSKSSWSMFDRLSSITRIFTFLFWKLPMFPTLVVHDKYYAGLDYISWVCNCFPARIFRLIKTAIYYDGIRETCFGNLRFGIKVVGELGGKKSENNVLVIKIECAILIWLGYATECKILLENLLYVGNLFSRNIFL